jgi:hypothetical protein
VQTPCARLWQACFGHARRYNDAMGKWASLIAALCSAAVCLTTVMLWLGSYRYIGWIAYAGQRDEAFGQTAQYLACEKGIVCYRHLYTQSRKGPGVEYVARGFDVNYADVPPDADPVGVARTHGREWGGFGYGRIISAYPTGGAWQSRNFRVEVVVPCWTLSLAFAVLPARWWVLRRRPVPGCCPRCGYDLRATSDRCPECGTSITTG